MTREYTGDEVYTGPSGGLHDTGADYQLQVDVNAPNLSESAKARAAEAVREHIAAAINAEETPMQAARRYAGHLNRLGSGLRERGLSLDHCGEDGLVELALSALDEAVKAARQWELSAMALQDRLSSPQKATEGALPSPRRTEGKSLPRNVDLGPDVERAANGQYPRGIDEMLEFAHGIIACAAGVEGPEPVPGWRDATKLWSARYNQYVEWYCGGPTKRVEREAIEKPGRGYTVVSDDSHWPPHMRGVSTGPGPAAGASAMKIEHLGIGEPMPEATISELAQRQQRDRQMWNQ